MRRSTLFLLAVILLGTDPSPALAQALKLDALQFPTTSIVGAWVSYRVRTQFRSLPPREYTQRVAIVAREQYQGRDGFWVELKTEGLPSGKRIERGFFVIVDPSAVLEAGESEEPPPDSLPKPERPIVRLVRYQVLTSGGKLFEYPISTSSEVRSGSEVSTVELFEYDSNTPAVRDTLGPDTLRIGRRVVPTIVERIRMSGVDTWPVPGDKTRLNRPLLTQQYWRNPAVPITGFARSLFQVTMQRVSVALADSGAAGDDAAAADSGAVVPNDGASRPDSASATPRVFTQTELTLLDLGADAVPEVTQVPEEGHLPAEGSPEGAR